MWLLGLVCGDGWGVSKAQQGGACCSGGLFPLTGHSYITNYKGRNE
jgi:hypothetical protein